MAAVAITRGETVPLSLQLDDGAMGKFPQAVVRDAAGAPLATVDLAHVSLGLYTATSLAMPDEAFLTVTYITYDDAPHTTESPDHLRAQDVFVQEVDPALAIEVVVTAAFAPGATTFATTLTEPDGFWNNLLAVVIDAGGTGRAIARTITGYLNADGSITLDAALPFTPTAGDPVLIMRRLSGVSVNAEVVPSTGAC